MNTIDYQLLTYQNAWKHRQQTGKTRNEQKTEYINKTPADRYKNAQPLMVPFDAKEESRKQNYKT
jgi:hypothetical protein